MASTLLKALLQARHWQSHSTFLVQYDVAARHAAPELVGRGPSVAQYGRWINAGVKRRPHPGACRVLEAMFPGYTIDQLLGEPDTATLPVQRTLHQGTLAARQSGSPVAPDRLHVPWEGVRNDEPPPAALDEELVMATDESARFVRQARGTVDVTVIEQLSADVADLARRYLIQPPYLTFGPLSDLRREVFILLDQRQRPTILPDLYRVAGQLCVLLAHASLDLGNAYAAETHTRTAWLCADLAESNQLKTYVRWVQSNIAFWCGNYGEAADIAQAGQQYATTGTSLLRLSSQAARAYAAAGDAREVEVALAAATTARDSADVSGDGPGGVFQFDRGKAAYYASEVRIALGGEANLRRAITDAEEALTYFASLPSDRRCAEFVAAAQIDRVSGHVALGDLDAAEEHLSSVFTLPAENRTVPIARRMGVIGQTLGEPRFAGVQQATSLRERIDFFGVYTAVRELPAG
jgi:hypothetical protein